MTPDIDQIVPTKDERKSCPLWDTLVRIDREAHSVLRVLLSAHYAVGSLATNAIEGSIDDEVVPALHFCDAATERTSLNQLINASKTATR